MTADMLQLWDVCSDQEAVDLVRNTHDPQAASKQLVDHALARFSTDNLSCMVVRFDHRSVAERQKEAALGVDRDPEQAKQGISEADAIVNQAKKAFGEGGGDLSKVTEEELYEEEEAQQEPGPELNEDALKAARKN